tara:strand:- start:976 stop:1230 length:255 start_codon:yes stop_codon:yes gene_type:complete
MTTLIIIHATIRTRKGPSIPCDMYFDFELLEEQYSMMTRWAVMECAIAQTMDYRELECGLRNDTGLDVVVRNITVRQTPQEEEE